MKTKKKNQKQPICWTLQRFETLSVSISDYDSETITFSIDDKKLFSLYVGSLEDIISWAKAK